MDKVFCIDCKHCGIKSDDICFHPFEEIDHADFYDNMPIYKKRMSQKNKNNNCIDFTPIYPVNNSSDISIIGMIKNLFGGKK